MKPIILKADQNGKLLITVDEIQKMVEDAYNEGVADGKASVQNRSSLTNSDLWQQTTSPTIPIYYGTEITCGRNEVGISEVKDGST